MSRALAALLLLAGCQEYELSNTVDPLGTGQTGDGPGGGTVPDDVPTGGISGRICAPNTDTWVAGAMVSVTHDYGASATFTNGEGRFLLEGLPVGTHTVHVTKGSFSTTFVMEVFADEITEAAYAECVQQGDTKIAVVTGQYDDIGALIGHLGIDYDTIPGVTGSAYVDLLRDFGRMSEYDAIFFNCGMGFDWLDHPETTENLRAYVEDGGSVYASDWAYYLVEASWPGKQRFHGDDAEVGSAFVGVSGTVHATVLDPVMADLLGSDTANLNYDLDSWAAAVSAEGEVLIEGTYRYTAGGLFGGTEERTAPLAFRFEDNGTALYTTFHNEQQTTVDMEAILQEIILSL